MEREIEIDMTDIPQIELFNEAGDNSQSVYTVHSSTENVNNKLKITVFDNDILIATATEMINVVNILPLKNEEYDIGSEVLRWEIIIGSQMFNDIAQSKTVRVHAGR